LQSCFTGIVPSGFAFASKWLHIPAISKDVCKHGCLSAQTGQETILWPFRTFLFLSFSPFCCVSALCTDMQTNTQNLSVCLYLSLSLFVIILTLV
jgi:hypothetical protein